jgi:hypothetical protein
MQRIKHYKMKQKLFFLKHYTLQLFKKGKSTSNLGLWNGKMEVAIYLFHLSQITQEEEYLLHANELIDDICENISNEIPFYFENGLLGIGCGLQYIINERFMEGDSDDILSEIDQVAINAINSRPINSLSFKSGVCGIAFYLYHRLKNRSEDNDNTIILKLKEYLIYLIDWIEELLLKTEEAQDYNDAYFLLCRLHKLNVFNYKVEKLLGYCLNKISTDESISINDNYRHLGIKSLQLFRQHYLK